MGNSQNLLDVRAKHKPVLEALWNAQKDGRLIRLCDLARLTNRESSNLHRALEELVEFRCVRRYEIDGEVLYGLGLFGEAIIEIEERYQNWMGDISIAVWQGIFVEWRGKP
jgi:DNA-binding IclR family transcriptional regulator